MKAFLMFRDRDVDLGRELPPNAAEIAQDLEINILLGAMSGADKFLLEVASRAVFASLTEPDAITYRQQILADCLAHRQVVMEMYAVAVEAIAREKTVWGAMLRGYPEGTLHRSVEVLQIFVEQLKKLRIVADERSTQFCSEGFIRFFRMLAEELNDEYLQSIDDHLTRLALRAGVLMTAELGKGNKGRNYVLRKPRSTRRSWKDRVQAWKEALGLPERGTYVYQIADRDESGYRALAELKGRGIGQIASALALSTDHILSFFKMLRSELGFYVCCLILREQLNRKGEPICIPEPLPPGEAMLCCDGLYDISLSLSTESKVVGNAVNANKKKLVMITGANRGGKSTFLRSLGLAQLMMQCGMFVPAKSFSANVCDGVYTHFKQEEDSGMKSGKFDEELGRMSALIDHLTPNSVLLLNESFASTNEREGSEIARQIVQALVEMNIKVIYVTHMFDLAHGFVCEDKQNVLFLRAERLADGQRTYRLLADEPLPTSYGEDLYRRIFQTTQDVT